MVRVEAGPFGHRGMEIPKSDPGGRELFEHVREGDEVRLTITDGVWGDQSLEVDRELVLTCQKKGLAGLLSDQEVLRLGDIPNHVGPTSSRGADRYTCVVHEVIRDPGDNVTFDAPARGGADGDNGSGGTPTEGDPAAVDPDELESTAPTAETAGTTADGEVCAACGEPFELDSPSFCPACGAAVEE